MEVRRFPRSVQALDAIFAFVDGCAAREGVSEDHAFEIRLAVEELFTNMVKYHPEGREAIGIALQREGPWFRAVLTDTGVERWDPTLAPGYDPGRPLEAQGAGGRGLHLVRQMMDEFRYDYRDRCSTITVARRVGRRGEG